MNKNNPAISDNHFHKNFFYRVVAPLSVLVFAGSILWANWSVKYYRDLDREDRRKELVQFYRDSSLASELLKDYDFFVGELAESEMRDDPDWAKIEYVRRTEIAWENLCSDSIGRSLVEKLQMLGEQYPDCPNMCSYLGE